MCAVYVYICPPLHHCATASSPRPLSTSTDFDCFRLFKHHWIISFSFGSFSKDQCYRLVNILRATSGGVCYKRSCIHRLFSGHAAYTPNMHPHKLKTCIISSHTMTRLDFLAAHTKIFMQTFFLCLHFMYSRKSMHLNMH